MSAPKITWDNKVSIDPKPTIPEVNKVTDDNMNNIKSVVGKHADLIDKNTSYIDINGTKTYNPSGDIALTEDSTIEVKGTIALDTLDDAGFTITYSGYGVLIVGGVVEYDGTPAAQSAANAQATADSKLATVTTDGVTTTGDGTPGDPIVANPATGVSVIQNIDPSNSTNPPSTQGILFDDRFNFGRSFGDYYTWEDRYARNTGAVLALAGFSCTNFIPFVNGDSAIATNTSKGGSFHNVNFYDSNKTFISGLDVNSGLDVILNSGNTPVNTAYIIFNSLTADSKTLTINGKGALIDRVTANESDIEDLQSDTILLDGDYFKLNGQYYNKTTGALQNNSLFKTTNKIPFDQNSTAKIVGSAKSGSLDNVNFYDSLDVFIGSIEVVSTQPTLYLNSDNIPINTAFLTINALVAKPNTQVTINRVSSVNDLSKQLVRHDWNNQKVGFYGDSITAADSFQKQAELILGYDRYTRGVGSSAMTFDVGKVAVQPDGTYITRRNLYASDLDFENAVIAAGFTNEVTTPTWLDYSADPNSYTLPANSWFRIDSQGSSMDRVSTLPLDTKVVSIMFSTNDVKVSSEVGDINDFGDNSGPGGIKSFIGSYRQCLSYIQNRLPNCKVILCIPPKKDSEYSVNTRTSDGVIFDEFRQAIRDIGSVYGYEVVDFTKVINFDNMSDYLQDLIHPTQEGYLKMGNYWALQASKMEQTDHFIN